MIHDILVATLLINLFFSPGYIIYLSYCLMRRKRYEKKIKELRTSYESKLSELTEELEKTKKENEDELTSLRRYKFFEEIIKKKSAITVTNYVHSHQQVEKEKEMSEEEILSKIDEMLDHLNSKKK